MYLYLFNLVIVPCILRDRKSRERENWHFTSIYFRESYMTMQLF
jgi:hypothetical protein